jgi:hypothetical protein
MLSKVDAKVNKTRDILAFTALDLLPQSRVFFNHIKFLLLFILRL